MGTASSIVFITIGHIGISSSIVIYYWSYGDSIINCHFTICHMGTASSIIFITIGHIGISSSIVIYYWSYGDSSINCLYYYWSYRDIIINCLYYYWSYRDIIINCHLLLVVWGQHHQLSLLQLVI